MSNWHTLQVLRAYSTGEAQAQRLLRRYIASLGRKASKSNNLKVEYNELQADAAARSAQLAKELRAQHLLKGFLRGYPYEKVEQSIRKTTPTLERLLKDVDIEGFFDYDHDAFLRWGSNPRQQD